MSRLIDGDALVAKMNLAIAMIKRTMKNFGIEDDPECQMELKTYQDIRDGIKEEPTIEPEQQWIPCSERLPKKPEPNPEFEGKPLDIYLVCKSGNIPFRAFWNGRHFADGWTTLDVDAWMPLPESYKEDSNTLKALDALKAEGYADQSGLASAT